MAYTYLLNLYEIIEERLTLVQEPGTDKKQQKIDAQFHQGRIDILNEFNIYLKNNMNAKLPKRIRKHLAALE